MAWLTPDGAPDEATLHDALELMRADGAGEAAIHAFAHQWREVATGATGLIPEAQIEPVGELTHLDALPRDAAVERAALDRLVVIRLNGGLGTSMGLRGPKSLLEVRDGQTFLDLIVRQVLALRSAHGARLPLLFMHSFATRQASLSALESWRQLPVEDLPLDFLQHREPKVAVADGSPVSHPAAPQLEWCPPGHGDLYPALAASGVLRLLLVAGYTHAFVANSDNLGAIADPRMVPWMEQQRVPFAMEVVRRTEADRKGGHLARRRSDGQLLLRETAQTSDEDRAAMQDLDRHRWANTNNLWIDLRALDEVMRERDGVLGLPLIRNAKTVDPTDPASTPVYQLESAMGAAIETFDGAQAIEVDRARFAPVKTTDDLLVLRSDAYEIDDQACVRLVADRDGRVPMASLDPSVYRMLPQFDARFPHGPPSLRACDRITVEGDVRFGAGVVARGEVVVRAERDGEQLVVPDGTVLD